MPKITARLAFLLMVGLFVAAGSTQQLAASAVTEACNEVCFADTECTTECYTANPDGPAFDTNCADYTEGQCSNTCDVTCTPYESGATECNGPGGDATTCGDYGVYLHCGDDFCAKPSENPDNCSADCFRPTPPGVVIVDPDDDGELCSERSSAGLGSLTCPSLLEGGTGMSCGEKALTLLDMQIHLNLLSAWVEYYEALADDCSCSDYDTLISQLEFKMMGIGTAYLSLSGQSCFPNG